MKSLLLSQLACWCNGRLVRAPEVVRIGALETDTRTLQGAERDVLFVALKGERFDGHDHVAEAARLGARAALVAREINCNLPQIVVEDTEHALAALAARLHGLRETLTLAITGSNGKTTVKQLAVSILHQVGTTWCNPGNRNNQIGLPLAVIDAPEDARFAVYELGAGQPGDIAWLADIVCPDIALVTTIAPAHLERLHTLIGIAETKAAIYDALPGDGVAVINADDAFAEFFAARAAGRRVVRFGLEASADIRARDIRTTVEGSHFVLMTPVGETGIILPLPGRHNVHNALAAAALAHAAGAPLTAIAAGLAAATPVPGRMAPHRLADGTLILDDSYNANPGSLSAAIATLAACRPAPVWLVLGDMRELGSETERLHAAAGVEARSAGVNRLFALGERSTAAARAFGEGAQSFATHAALVDVLRGERAHSQQPPVILVKGSRGSRMDIVVDALLDGTEVRHAA